ncbi:alanyl dipeptidyl peptidase [Acidisarcina polymorpha]|uniref:Alanyl dipeptidyl peptidase n=1 Tax=Acidisarcina polymorpha TaxID=2211140 RepID=A0A2Z5G2R4_9BACT|nr:S9 family peptidase [Acidisarcina polymorpha]AXC13388.1 alanyl dipeptidyl peptidase [Acidisarcina polymorpha]
MQSTQKVAAFCIFALAAAQLPAQSRRPMTFEDMMKMRRLGDIDLSKDGKWVLFSATDVDLEKNTKTSHLWIVPTGGGKEVALTASLAGESRGRFSPDGKQILFLSPRDGGQQIYLAPFDGETGTLGEAHKLTSISTEADGATWSPDGQSILFTSAVYPDCPATPDQQDACDKQRDDERAASKVKARIFTALLYRHWNAFTGDKRSHLFLVPSNGGTPRDLNPGDTHDVPPFSLGGPDAYAFSPDSKEIAFEENLDAVPATSTHVDIFTLRLDDPAAKPVKFTTSAGGNFSPAYSPDGKYIAFRSQARAGYESDRFRLMLFDRQSKQITDPMPAFDNWVDEFLWHPGSHNILFTSGDRGEEPLYQLQLDSTGGDRFRLINITKAGEFGDAHMSTDGRTLVVAKMTVRMPGEILVLNAAATSSASNGSSVHGIPVIPAEEKQITHLNTGLLTQIDLPSMDSFWFPSIGKVKVQGFVIRPPGFDPGKKYPVKLIIHGGPQGALGDSWSYRWNAELFAANGYVVLMINPRGSTGYGQAFVDGVNGDWGGKPFIDLMRGLDYAERSFPYIDKTRECAMGASYGGYMANWILGHTDRFKCIVSHDGMFNPVSAYGDTEELWFNEWEFKGKPWDYYGKPASLDPYRKWSPALAAKNFKTPTLVIHSQLDYRLDVSEGFQLFTTLQRQNIPSKMLYFPDEGHWVLKPQNSQLWYKTVNDWVDQYTKPQP